VLYQEADGTYFRGNQNLCVCLPPRTRIATPHGEREIAGLAAGDTVWTVERNGDREAKPLLLIRRVPVHSNHLVTHLKLSDGRSLVVSPLHPDAGGCALGDLVPGDMLDGAVVLRNELKPYRETATWDILPAGETGLYRANGILIGSTLSGSLLTGDELTGR
jgi:hypothetical protein